MLIVPMRDLSVITAGPSKEGVWDWIVVVKTARYSLARSPHILGLPRSRTGREKSQSVFHSSAQEKLVRV
jgi:hypothetical protein